MSLQIKPAPIRKTVSVKAAPERAFRVFTADMTRWWHPDHHLGKSPLKSAVVEPRAGGRWYEIDEDGTECNWGKVLVWEPPARVVFAWQLTAEWKYDPEFITEIEVRFIPDGTGTRVELEHRHIERYAERAEAVRALLDAPEGWTLGMTRFAAIADASD